MMKDFDETKKLDYYWADEPEPDRLISHIQLRCREMKHAIRRSGLLARIERNHRYYYNRFYNDNVWSDTELQASGQQSEKLAAAFNHFRSIVQSIINIAVGFRPAFSTTAVNTETESLLQAKLGKNLIDYYLQVQGLEKNFRRATEHALVLTMGFTAGIWDSQKGAEIDVDKGKIVYEGDIDAWNPTLFDMCWDFANPDQSKGRWQAVRRPENKWEILERVTDEEDKRQIMGMSWEDESDWQWRMQRYSTDISDYLPVWKFYHLKTPALPYGREIEFVGDVLIGHEEECHYKTLPVKAMVPSELMLTGFGHSVGFDLQGPSEALNAEYSTILSIHRNFGCTRIWTETGDDITHQMLERDFAHVQSDTKPEALNLGQAPADLFTAIDKLEKELEYISGVNAAFRGQPEASLKSGTALAVVDAKAVQHNAPVTFAYHAHMQEFMTSVLEILQMRPVEGRNRVIAITGRNRRQQQAAFTPKDIDRLQRVVVEPGNPLMRTMSGRLEYATLALNHQLIDTNEELLNVLETGNIEVLTESKSAQLDLVHAENDRLLEGGNPPTASIIDDHVLHIKEHAGTANSPDVREDEEYLGRMQAHVMQHMQLLMSPSGQMVQVLLGYQAPPAPGGGSPPAQKGSAPPPKQKETPLPSMDELTGQPEVAPPAAPRMPGAA